MRSRSRRSFARSMPTRRRRKLKFQKLKLGRMTVPNKRGGITVSSKGAEHPWGFWRWDDDVQNEWVQRAGGTLNMLENIAAPTFHLYRGIIEKRPGLIIPQPEIRLANVRA